MIEDKCAGGEGIRWLVSDEWLEQAVLCDGRPPSHALEASEDEWFGRVNFSLDFLQRLGVVYIVRCRIPRIRLRTTIDHEKTWDTAEEPAKKMRRKLENESTLGGMWWPTKARTSVPGWDLVVGIKHGESWMQLQKNTKSTFVVYSTPLVKRATKMLCCKLGERRARR